MIIKTIGKQIYDRLLAGMPTPAAGQTLICKTVSAHDTWQTIHTVSAGKTFYLMGVACLGNDTATLRWLLSFDGGTTVHMQVGYTPSISPTAWFEVVSTGWPIAQVGAGKTIKAKSTTIDTSYYITVWGWEE